jgi:hypothetical protein
VSATPTLARPCRLIVPPIPEIWNGTRPTLAGRQASVKGAFCGTAVPRMVSGGPIGRGRLNPAVDRPKYASNGARATVTKCLRSKGLPERCDSLSGFVRLTLWSKQTGTEPTFVFFRLRLPFAPYRCA